MKKLDPLIDLSDKVDDVLNDAKKKLADFPTKLPKKTRCGGDESYPPMGGGKAY